MIIQNAIRNHLRLVLGEEPEHTEIEFYKSLIVAIANNPNVNALSYEAISFQIIDRADTLIKKLLEKK
jgi:hypothetical protein